MGSARSIMIPQSSLEAFVPCGPVTRSHLIEQRNLTPMKYIICASGVTVVFRR